MIKNLLHDPVLLSKVSIKSNKQDKQIANDLKDTLEYYKETCVGMAANMIGEYKCIIAFYNDDGSPIIMFNPEIIEKHFEYTTIETCLSYISSGTKVKRYKIIKVRYEDKDFKTKIGIFKDFTAQIIQHEIDHTKGILV